MLTLIFLTSVLIHGQCILWVSGKQRTLWKTIYLSSNLFHETLSLWLCIHLYPCTLSYLGQCLSENYLGKKILLLTESGFDDNRKQIEAKECRT